MSTTTKDTLTLKADFQTLDQAPEIKVRLEDAPSNRLLGKVEYTEEPAEGSNAQAREKTIEGPIVKEGERHYIKGAYYDVLVKGDVTAVRRELLRQRAASTGKKQCLGRRFDRRRDVMIFGWIDEEGTVTETFEQEY